MTDYERGWHAASERWETKVERLQALASELLENKGRLEQMEKDFQPGLPERRLADDLLDAIQAFEAAKDEKKNPHVCGLQGFDPNRDECDGCSQAAEAYRKGK